MGDTMSFARLLGTERLNLTLQKGANKMCHARTLAFTKNNLILRS